MFAPDIGARVTGDIWIIRDDCSANDLKGPNYLQYPHLICRRFAVDAIFHVKLSIAPAIPRRLTDLGRVDMKVSYAGYRVGNIPGLFPAGIGTINRISIGVVVRVSRSTFYGIAR